MIPNSWHVVHSDGSYFGGLIIALLLVIVFTFSRKPTLAANYWGAGATTLEWTVPSPAPHHTFEEMPGLQ